MSEAKVYDGEPIIVKYNYKNSEFEINIDNNEPNCLVFKDEVNSIISFAKYDDRWLFCLFPDNYIIFHNTKTKQNCIAKFPMKFVKNISRMSFNPSKTIMILRIWSLGQGYDYIFDISDMLSWSSTLRDAEIIKVIDDTIITNIIENSTAIINKLRKPHINFYNNVVEWQLDNIVSVSHYEWSENEFSLSSYPKFISPPNCKKLETVTIIFNEQNKIVEILQQ